MTNTITVNSWIKVQRENMFRQVVDIDVNNDTIHLEGGGTIMGIDWANGYYQITDTKGACERALQLINSGVYRTNQFRFREFTRILVGGGSDTYWEYVIDRTFSYLYENKAWYLSVMVEGSEIKFPLVGWETQDKVMCCCYNRFI